MHMFFRTMMHMLVFSRRKPRLGHYDVAHTNFRVLPTDLDILNHMNNGVYLSIMDVARFDMLVRNGVWAIFKERGWYPVVVAETISFRKSLEPWQRFTIESRILGFDDKAVYVEQRFVRPDADGNPEIYAQGFIRGRFLKRSGGVVAIEDLLEAVGAVPEEMELPEWLLRWAPDVALPATRAEAPSVWS
ncbi:thioesterase family protein [Microterricola pindariensis]|uniref:4-hydroxybenzoyl-CoA thioesterase n=1 Tax=Microterricola pindariensis TaxID=478010 RepID=A0ABX5AZ62_9MICO|nr:thioesterase family protein [Microterricola pindariensis]PPL19659.1 4-hydroxybenzoyl-CoA thioesterase [Microterricola pindariensis]